MKQWKKGLIVGVVLTAWSFCDLRGEVPSITMQILNYLGWAAGIVVLIGSFILRSREAA